MTMIDATHITHATQIAMASPRNHSDDDDHHDGHDDSDHGVAVATSKPKLQKPPMYHVLILNDDYTPMDFVVEILEKFFRMNYEQATQVMLEVHHKGQGVCGVFTPDIAETKVVQVNEYARENEHPLLCVMEPAEE